MKNKTVFLSLLRIVCWKRVYPRRVFRIVVSCIKEWLIARFARRRKRVVERNVVETHVSSNLSFHGWYARGIAVENFNFMAENFDETFAFDARGPTMGLSRPVGQRSSILFSFYVSVFQDSIFFRFRSAIISRSRADRVRSANGTWIPAET